MILKKCNLVAGPLYACLRHGKFEHLVDIGSFKEKVYSAHTWVGRGKWDRILSRETYIYMKE
jgi:hypothetical protein